MHPIGIPTAETFQFVVEHIRAPMRILEAGCGGGELAARLQAAGFEVQAIDTDPSQVASAKERGVDATVADFLAVTDGPFEAILFGRSLHHMFPLVEAVGHARRLLTPAGRIVVEDFAFDEIDPRTVQWLYGVLAVLRACERLRLDGPSFGRDLLDSRGDVDVWRREHGGKHRIHTARAMASAMREEFTVTFEATAPYLYRYVAPMLPDDEAGGVVLSAVLELENGLIEKGAIEPIGRRFVGQART